MALTGKKPLVIFDTSPLIAFACAGVPALSGLGQLVEGRAIWTDAVHQEVMYQVQRREDLRCAGRLLRTEWLHLTTLDSPKDLEEIERLRSRLARRNDSHLKHLGESASLVLARRFPGSFVALDDRDGKSLAKALGITVVTTLDLVANLVTQDLWTTVEGCRALEVASRTSLVETPTEQELEEYCSQQFPRL